MAYNKNKNTSKPVKNEEATPEEFKTILDIDDPNERAEALAEATLSEGQKDAAQVAAKEDFLGGDVQGELFEEEEVKQPNAKAQKLLDELQAKGVAVSYPTDFSKWDASTYERLEKLNK